MLEWLKSLLKKKERPEPRVIEYRGMKAYFDTEMIEEFERNKIDYEKAFRESVDEALDNEETDEENQYK